jgi:hypothetical protein
MYKKINHMIVEQHYGKDFKKFQLSAEPLPSSVINEKTMLFRMDSRTLWTKYALGLINFSVAEVNSIPNTNQIESRQIKSAIAIGDFFAPYYGITAANRIGQYLSGIFKVGIDFTESVKQRRDTDSYTLIWQPLIEDLSTYLNQLNPSQWPKVLLEEMLAEMTKYWQQSIQARFDENFSQSEQAIDGLFKLVVTGIPNHFNKGYQSLADVISRGIIAQYPLEFAEYGINQSS